ncbi:protein Hook homolog 1 [Phasianus colchicus]|uniref:protein Hook homolog 1 n=1 Tax=Phasianus colchicus TaxID=9054 RepID=UPI00129E9144|nr:protein Hook homolog 1 [Phasianus colchicus]
MEAKAADPLLCDSLILWLQTFNTAAPCRNVQDLTNGVAMAQVLHQIDVAWFDASWLNRIKEDVGDNWRIKSSNLKKILQGIMDYYHEFLDQQISEELIPDLNKISEKSDPTELGRLMQLILGCAVNCERKQEHIQNIMTLEESVQHVVMTAIQELMSKEAMGPSASDAPSEMEQQLKKALEDLQEAIAEKEELAQRCQELDLQVAALQDEKNSLVSENEILNDRLEQLDDSLDDPNTVVAKKYFHAQLQLEQLQEENFRLEAAKDDYRVHCEDLEKQLIELQHRNNELTSLAEESRALKDENDILRATADKASKLESTVEVYRKKLQDLNDFRRQVKSLQETNMMYMHNTVSLEDELRKANAARAQLETYKRQVGLHFFFFFFFREMFIQLQHENKMLLLQQEGSENERITELQKQLEQKQWTVNELETEKRLNKERIGELQQQIEDLQKTLQEQGSKTEGSSNLKQKLAAHMEKLSEVHDELQKKEAALAELQPDVSQNPQKIGELEAALRKKDEDMKAMEERYKMYLEKARNVIKTLDPKLNPASAEIMLLRKQITERDKKIEALEAEYKLAKLRDYEENLIVTAWYNKSLTLQKLGMEARLLGSDGACRDGPGRSFLAQQRHVTNTRRNLPVKVPSATSD